ncbi:hypothetical protein FSP39_019279 [Pinctada imbricata]|uniref:Transmembrane protein 26 n=1 Tax=Pinctada imbricata TaxID=66713 RepID=A0AA88Y1C1_PINIB|nr:hypothetical protein FSP39_019279 [Pinctada imbricata]
MKRITTIRVAAEGKCMGIYESEGKRGVSTLANIAKISMDISGLTSRKIMDHQTEELGKVIKETGKENPKRLSVANENGVNSTSFQTKKVQGDHSEVGSGQYSATEYSPVQSYDVDTKLASQSTSGSGERVVHKQTHHVPRTDKDRKHKVKDIATLNVSYETDRSKFTKNDSPPQQQATKGTKRSQFAQNETSENKVGFGMPGSATGKTNKQANRQDDSSATAAQNFEQNVAVPRKRHEGASPGGVKRDKEKIADKPVSQQKESRRSKIEEVQDKINIIQAILVRCLLALSSLLSVWRAADVRQDDIYWLLGLTNVILAIETFLVVKFRRGKETIWACPCFLIYLAGTVPSMWILQLDKNERYNVSSSEQTNTSAEALSTIQGVTLPFALEPDTWVSVLQQSLLFILVIGRMILPRGDLSREQLSQLLFVYIGSGSDVVEFLVVFDEPEFRSNTTLLYATLIIWSFSLIQFTLVITSTKNPKKTRFGFLVETPGKEGRPLFGIEIISLWISIIFMDGPYLALRLYAMIEVGVLSYGIIFFACKNILMLILLFYRMSIICVKMNSREKRKDKNALLDSSRAHNQI